MLLLSLSIPYFYHIYFASLLASYQSQGAAGNPDSRPVLIGFIFTKVKLHLFSILSFNISYEMAFTNKRL